MLPAPCFPAFSCVFLRSPARYVGRIRAAIARVREKRDRQKVQDSLESLSPRERQTIELVALQGLTLREAAEIMGVTLGSASSYLKRAKASMKKELEKPAVQPPDFQETWSLSLELLSRRKPS